MLIRFLSYIASVIGAKRYKPLLITCLALVFSITGISIVGSALRSGSPKVSSQVGQTSTKAGTEAPAPTTLNGLQQKSTKQDTGNGTATPQQPNSGNSDAKQGQNNNNDNTSSSTTVFDINLNTSTVNLTQASPTAAIIVTPTVNGTIQWTITPADSNGNSGVSVTIEPAKDNSGNAVIRLRADNIAPGTYTFAVSAKDAAHNQTVNKTLTVTVN